MNDSMSNSTEALENARKAFGNDIFATKTTGIVIDAVGDHYAKCSLVIEPKHLNAVGTVMGGAIFTLADFAFAVASNHAEMNTQSLTSQITYLSVAKGTRLIAEANCVKSGRSTCFYNITVTDDTERLVASISTTGFIKR